MQLNTEAGRKWYRLSMYIVWSAELNKPASVFGMFQDIDTGYRELEKLQSYEAPEAQLSAEALDCDIPEITEAQAVNIMKYFGRMFEFVRLVDPEIWYAVYNRQRQPYNRKASQMLCNMEQIKPLR